MNESTDKEVSCYRPMTIEEINEENEKFQKKLIDKMHRELPAKLDALYNMEGSYEEDSDDDIAAVGQPSIGEKRTTNGHANGTDANYQNHTTPSNYNNKSYDEEREMLLSVREREVKELNTKIDEMRQQHQMAINDLKDQLARTSMEKKRSTVSFKESQDHLTVLQDKFSTLQDERDRLLESEKTFKRQLDMQRLTVEDKDRMIKILENGSQDNRKISQLEKQLEAKDEKYQAVIQNLNDELALSFKKCKNLEIEVFELEKKVKRLDERNDEMMTQKAETVTRLMGQIQVLEDRMESRSITDSDPNVQRLLSEARTVERSLRNKLVEKETMEAVLRQELDAMKIQLNECNKQEEESENDLLRARVVNLEQELAVQAAKKLELTNVNGPSMSLDDYNARYMRFHEEQMATLRTELEVRLRQNLEEKDNMIESLQAENEEIKKIYVDQEGKSSAVNVQKLEDELATATSRLEDLRRTHLEHCQPELEKRETEINNLKMEVEQLTRKLVITEEKEKLLKNQLNKTEEENKDKIQEIAACKNKIEEMNVQIVEYQKLISQQSAELGCLKDEIKRIHFLHQEEKEALVTSLKQKAQSSMATSPIRLSPKEPTLSGSLRNDGDPIPVERNREDIKSVGTSPVMKSLTEPEVVRLLHSLASKHEDEILEYEARIEEMQLHARVSSIMSQKLVNDAATSTDPMTEPSTELTLELWRKLEELRKQNEQLTARSKRSEDTEKELEKINEQFKILHNKALRQRAELATAAEKYKKLKEQAKTYKEYFTKIISSIKDDWERERLKWEKERGKWEKERDILEKGQKFWDAERKKREKALIELQTEVRNLKLPQPYQGIESVAKMYDELIANQRKC